MAESRVKIDITPNIAAIVRPGDNLILGFNRSIAEEECAMLRDKLSTLIPGIKIIVIDNVSSMVVHKPDEHDNRKD